MSMLLISITDMFVYYQVKKPFLWGLNPPTPLPLDPPMNVFKDLYFYGYRQNIYITITALKCYCVPGAQVGDDIEL
jgi:hypothetical protein